MNKDYTFGRMEDNKLITYCCGEVQNLHEKWKKEFRDANGVRMIDGVAQKDKHYEEYCKNIDDFLTQCSWNTEKCHNCSSEDHEGQGNRFCRCESRNIWVAKQLRQMTYKQRK